MVRDICVFEGVYQFIDGVGGLAGRRLGRLGRRWWTTCACSRVWPRLLVVVWVVSVVWVTCLWTTFVVLVWAFRVFEVVGVAAGRRLGRLVACVWSPLVLVRRASVCEATFEAVGRENDTERCVIVTQHVVGWGGKHPNTREHTEEHEGVGEARYAINPRHPRKHTFIRGRGGQ